MVSKLLPLLIIRTACSVVGYPILLSSCLAFLALSLAELAYVFCRCFDESSVDEEHEDEVYYDEETEAAYVVGIETALFTREDVLLDSQASVNVFSNENLLHDIGVAKKAITLKGVELGTRGVSIRNEGDFDTLGKVYYSANTTANILDSGNSITYEQADDSFILKSKDSEEKYIFSRKPIGGSEGRFYCCNMKDKRAASPPFFRLQSRA